VAGVYYENGDRAKPRKGRGRVLILDFWFSIW
jgi:hypothetical protein